MHGPRVPLRLTSGWRDMASASERTPKLAFVRWVIYLLSLQKGTKRERGTTGQDYHWCLSQLGVGHPVFPGARYAGSAWLAIGLVELARFG